MFPFPGTLSPRVLFTTTHPQYRTIFFDTDTRRLTNWSAWDRKQSAAGYGICTRAPVGSWNRGNYGELLAAGFSRLK